MEVWKVVTGFPNYEANCAGQVRNVVTDRTLKGNIRPDGYRTVMLVDRFGRRNTLLLHRVIARTWIPNPNEKRTVDHVNGDRGDNRLENLRWFTHGEQIRARRNVDHRRGVRKVVQLRKNRSFVAVHSSGAAAAISLGKGPRAASHISATAAGRLQSAYGFIWEFVAPLEMAGETWADLDPGLIGGRNGYMISDHGRVRNRHGQVSSGHLQSSGYRFVSMGGQFQLHRLVAQTFVPNPNNKPYVNHIDRDKGNACAQNLEWVTGSENCQHWRALERSRSQTQSPPM